LQLISDRIANARQGLTLVIMATLPTLAIASLVPILPALFERFGKLPHGEFLVPMVLTVPSLCVALFSSFIGAAADRWGRRRTLMPALAAFAVFGLAPFLVDNLFEIIAARFVVGVAEAAILTVSNALLGDYFDDVGRKRWLAMQTIIGPFAAFAYVLMGGALGTWNWRGPFLLYLMGIVVLIPSLLFLYEPRKVTAAVSKPPVSAFPWLAAIQVSAVTLLISVVFFVQNVQHGRIFADLGARSPGLISVVITIAGLGTVVAGIAFRYIRSQSIGTWLAIIFLAYAIGYAGLSQVSGYLMGIPFDALGQLAGGLAVPVLISWALTRFDFEHRGRGMGIWAACFFLGQFLSPPLVTLIGHGRWTFLQSVGVVGLGCLPLAALAWLMARFSREADAQLISTH
jgi:MFS family permease